MFWKNEGSIIVQVVWEAALAWVNHNLDDRQSLIGQLLARVRLSLLPPRYCETCLVSFADNADYLKKNHIHCTVALEILFSKVLFFMPVFMTSGSMRCF